MRRGLYLLVDESNLPSAQWDRCLPAVLDTRPALVQYRAKALSRQQQQAAAQRLLRWCQARELPLLLNDDPALAAQIGADGVHLGQADSAVAPARALLGATAIIGVSCYADLNRAAQAQAVGASYVSFGAVAASATKPLASRLPADFLPRARAASALPLCLIGGIDAGNAPALLAQGADLLCVAGGIWRQADPASAAAKLVTLCHQHFA